MPFLVHCPSGCKLQVPRRKAGRIIRCPRCQRLIEVPVPPPEDAPASGAASQRPATQPRLDVRAQPFEIQEALVEAIGQSELPAGQGLVRRAEQSRQDRVLVARLFAGLLILIAIINLAPSAACWWRWIAEGEPVVWARWMYLQFFVAGVLIIYAVFLAQITDWSALRTVAVLMLGLAIAFGAVSSGLLLGGERGAMGDWLDLSPWLIRRAVIWSVAMLCLSVLGSYLAGRESANWQRTEQLLQEILTVRAAGGSVS